MIRGTHLSSGINDLFPVAFPSSALRLLPATPIYRTTVKSQRHRIDLRTRRRELQQRAATYRASRDPYPIEVHLLWADLPDPRLLG